MDDFHMTCFTPLPGTAAFRMAGNYGIFNPDWEKASMFTPDNFIPYGLTYDKMLVYHKKAYKIFYLRPKIIIYFLLKMLKSKTMFIKITRSFMGFLKYTFLKSSMTNRNILPQDI